MYFFFNDTATTEIYTYGHTLSLHDALPICRLQAAGIEVDDEGVETTDVAQGLDDVRRRAAAASQDGADTGQQFTRIERLAEIVVGAEFEADDAVDLVAFRRQHQDRQGIVAAQPAADRQTDLATIGRASRRERGCQ